MLQKEAREVRCSFLPHWLHWREALQCASLPRCNPGTTCRWPGHRAFPAAPLGSGRSDSGYTGISAKSKHSRLTFPFLPHKSALPNPGGSFKRRVHFSWGHFRTRFFYCWRGETAYRYPLSELTWAAKVHYFDGTPLGVTEEDVLRLQVTVDDAELRRGQEEKRRA